MKRPLRHTLSALALTGLALAAVGCGAVKEKAEEKVTEKVDQATNETYEVTYEITGSGTASVDFNGGKGTATAPELETLAEAKLPWTKTVTLKGIAAPTVQAVIVDGEVSCKITHKGKVIKENSAKGAAAAASCVAISPIVK
ncbi:MmpS family transport accessory protein [Streptomyces albireticuli]|uniref:MmpS family transport accessory protein n=1 Tax=Streptomyces albireticuli TaxID=1940 RepID=UPI0036C24B7A